MTVRRVRASLGALLLSTTAALLAVPAPARSATVPGVTRVLVFVEENHSLAQMQSQMPYAFSLAQRYGYATNFHATRHPSLPNYIAIASGSTRAITDDKAPKAHQLIGRSVFGASLRKHHGAKIYAESMPSPCAQFDAGNYAVRHNPWAYFIDERAACNRDDRPLTSLRADISAGRLPAVGMVIPDLSHDAHNGSLASADAWFKSQMQRVFAGPDWQSGRLAVVLTADEDDRTSGNKVLTVVIHPSQHHHVVSRRLTQYSLTRLLNDVAHAPRLGAAATAPALSAAFGLPMH